ncbi:ATP-binding protein [Desulfosporosinus sp. SYSU MS00001]|uniref:ATP-binding protein n=1 Tax=Desulfosporosinus sp. SYSU MS00001 TaxID=3416284 RepID=UPI003CEEB565
MKQLLILSGKGGTGKTTVASAFIKLSEARAFADCDVDAPNLHLILHQSSEARRANFYGMAKAAIDPELCVQCGLCQQHCRFEAIQAGDPYNVDSLACEGCGVCEAICPAKAISFQPSAAGDLMLYSGDNVFSTARLKMGSGNSGMLVTEVKRNMKYTAINADLAIVDGSPGIGCPVIASLNGVDMVLVVAEPSISGISDMERIIKTAEKFQTRIAICINKYDTSQDNTEKIESFCQRLKLPIVGKIPFDPAAVRAINEGKSIVEMDCASGRAVKDVFDQTISLL